jgi:hypothetical protein
VYLLSTLPLLSFLHSTPKSWHCCRSQPATNFNLQKLLQSNQLFNKSTRINHIARNAGPHYSRPSFRVCVVFQLSKSTVPYMFSSGSQDSCVALAKGRVAGPYCLTQLKNRILSRQGLQHWNSSSHCSFFT